MKKIISLFIIAIMIIIPITSYCASVTPITIPGNDANPNQYTPPLGSVRSTLPNSDKIGTHIYNFNEFGILDSQGTDILTLEIGKVSGTDYTQVLSWNWNGSSDLYGIIVKGGPAFNLYQYTSQTSDTFLTAPTNPGGNIADISHVSVIIFPQVQPPPPPTPPNCNIFIITLLVFILILNLITLYCCYCK